MKMILASFLLLSLTFSFAQQSDKSTYYVNSEKVKFENIFILPKSIESVDIVKGTPNGEVFIKTSQPMLSLNEVLELHGDLSTLDHSTLVKINGTIIENLEGIQIDPSYFVYIDVLELSDAEYLKGKFRNLRVLQISLETNERKNNDKDRIRFYRESAGLY